MLFQRVKVSLFHSVLLVQLLPEDEARPTYLVQNQTKYEISFK